MLARLGFEWAATDEGILAQSIDDWEPEESRYRAYRAPGQGNEPALLFRDRELSDLIGFTYANNAAVHSVEDFCGRLQKIGAGTADDVQRFRTARGDSAGRPAAAVAFVVRDAERAERAV